MQLVTVVLDNIPMVNPFRLDMGPAAYQAAYNAIRAALDKELQPGRDGNHSVAIADAGTTDSASVSLHEPQPVTSDQDSSPAKKLRMTGGSSATTTSRMSGSEPVEDGTIGEKHKETHSVLVNNAHD